jgi:hypothetical protein
MPATIQRLGENPANSKTRIAMISPAKAPRNLAQYGVPDFFIVIFSKAPFRLLIEFNNTLCEDWLIYNLVLLL